MCSMAAAALAFFAGVLTVAAPCSLPLLPALLGASVGQSGAARPAFITLGFVVSFTVVAVFFSVVTQIAGIDQTALRSAAAALLASFGAFLLWPRPFEWLWLQIGSRFVPGDRIITRFAQGNFGAFALGTALGLVWTPCAGPILASILTLIATATTLASGAVLLAVYAVGAAVPLLVIGWGGQAVTGRVRILARHAHRLQQGLGAAIIAFAAATYFDYDALIAAWLSRFYPGASVGF
jgi:cytochrome c-type biogenesis protein